MIINIGDKIGDLTIHDVVYIEHLKRKVVKLKCKCGVILETEPKRRCIYDRKTKSCNLCFLKDKYIGTVFESKTSGKFVVVSCRSSRDMTVRFIDTGYEVVTCVSSILVGGIKDPFKRRVFNTGFIGKGNFKTSSKFKGCRIYKVWKNMLARCYSNDLSCIKYYQEKGVTVCEEWHNFQNFATWFVENYSEGMVLDKDIKNRDAKIYSPETCSFVSQRDNVVESATKIHYITHPNGVNYCIPNLIKFCEDYNLNYCRMISISTGNHKKYRGWSRNED